MRSAMISGLALAGVTLFTASASLAQPPWECTTGSGARGYEEGRNLQRNLLQFLWATRFDCDTLEDFIYAVDVPLSRTPSTSSYLRCRDVGIVHGIRSVIEEKQTACGWMCFDQGLDIGEMQARIYCRLPEPYKREAQISLALCTIATEQACKGALRSEVNNLCPASAASDPLFEEFVEKACDFQAAP